MRSLRKTPASSISRTYGRICSRANLRTVAWNRFSSSGRAVSGGGSASTPLVAGMSAAYSTGIGSGFYRDMATAALVSVEEYLATTYKRSEEHTSELQSHSF